MIITPIESADNPDNRQYPNSYGVWLFLGGISLCFGIR
jgi:hypothetical protein